MVSFRATQRAFSAGEISPYLHVRSDLDVYGGALKRSENFITDQFGALHRRPGTEFVAKVKAKPCFYPYSAGKDCSAVIVATPNCFQLFVDRVQIGTDIDTPYTESEYCDLKIANDCGAMFIAHENHPPRFLVKTDEGLELKDFPKLPYAELNKDSTCRLCLEEGGSASTGSMTVTTDAWDTGETIEIFDPAGASLGSSLLGVALGGNSFEVPFISGIPSGVYLDQNGDQILIEASGAVLKAYGCEPFTPEMVGQFVRVLDEDGACKSSRLVEVYSYEYVGNGPDDQPLGDYDLNGGEYVYVGPDSGRYIRTAATVSEANEAEKNTPNTWLSLRIIEFISETEILVSYAGCALKCTDLFCLPAFGDGIYPSSIWVHQNRLWMAKENCLIGSAVGDFFNWEKTEPDGSVNPDNAVYTKLDAGACHDIQWLRTVGQYLVAGTDRAIYAIGGGGGAIAADDYVQQVIQSVGVAPIEPLSIGEDLLFIDRTGARIYSVAPGVQYDQLSLTEKTIFADHIGEKRFAGMAFQETKFPIVWVYSEDGELFALTYWPSQNVRGWSRHRLGGRVISGGCSLPPVICALASQRGTDEASDIVYFAVKRTIEGQDVYFIETMGDFFGHCDKPESAHYLDAAMRIGEVVEFPSGRTWSGPENTSLGTVGRVAICDKHRWYYGSDDGEVLRLEAPNTTKVSYGRTMADARGDFETVPEPQYGQAKKFIGPECCLFDPPCGAVGYAVCQHQIKGLECFEGEALVTVLDGQDCGHFTVSDGEITGVEGCVGWIGYPYISEAEMLPWVANLGVSDGAGENSAVTGISANVYRTPSLKAVIPVADNYYQIAEEAAEMINADSDAFWGNTFASGWFDAELRGVTGRNDGGGITLRADGPFPATVRAVKPRFSVSVRV